MMDCSAFKELSGLRHEDLSADERARVDAHRDRCEVCRREQSDDEELLALVDRWATLESDVTAASVRALDGIDEVSLAGSPEVSSADPAAGIVAIPARPGRRWIAPASLLALAAAVALALVIVPRPADDDAALPPGQRLKGAATTTAAAADGAVELQFSVETPRDSGPPALERGIDAGAYGGRQTLLFGVHFDGAGHIVLIEEAPARALQVVAPRDGLRWAEGSTGVRVLQYDGSSAGAVPVGYRPDGPSGEYRYTALLTSAESRAPETGDAARLLAGEPVPGIEVRARDAIVVRWDEDDAGEDLR